MSSPWWRLFSRLLGLRRRRPQPICSKGAVAVGEKLLDTRELAAQVSDMVAESVVNRLTAIGLTAENIKKLEYLAAAPPLGAVGGSSQAASLADAVLGQLTAIGLTEENVKKLAILGGASGEGSQAARRSLHLDDTEDLSFPSSSFTEDPFDSSTWVTERNRQRGSLSSSQMSTGRLKRLAEGPLLSESSQFTKPFRPPQTKLHPFDTFPRHYDSPIQSSRRRKRVAVPEAITWREDLCPIPKKRKWQDEVDYATDWFSTESDMDTHLRASGSEENSQHWRADGESQSSGTSAHELVRGGNADHLVCPSSFTQDSVPAARLEPTPKQGVEVSG
ncbi:hypothetical protein L210DRAFT_2207127 [Boletus edulis BED1]|uniref:Uncharacterized protein n=1 Tax=Boletus edulis BED1 TaxID=1328754 RepID=A0AAD4BE86_BOLED|nr:hypothetical protein L210DRAFT_2207127 [Boletus edulis BED1]